MITYSGCPLDAWVTLAWAATYALYAEVGLLALSLASARIRLCASRRVIVSLFAVILFVIVAAMLAIWISQRNQQICIVSFAHYSPELATRVRRHIAEATAQANVASGVIAAALLVGTALSVVTLDSGMRGKQRVTEKARA